MAIMTESAAPFAARDKDRRNRALVRGWLYLVLAVLVALVMVGGATRMTGSGLSITEWQPIHGVIPPLNAGQWQEEFEKYQQIPQFQKLNSDINKALKQPEFAKFLQTAGLQAADGTSEELGKLMRETAALWAPTIDKLGIKLD